MQLNKHMLLTTTLACAAILGSLAIGVALGRSPQLFDIATDDSKQETREAILDKLAQSAQQQAQTQASIFDPFSQSGLGGDPFQALTQMQSHMAQLFGNISTDPSLFNFGAAGFGGGFVNVTQPKIEVEESKEEYRVVISLAKDSDMELSTELDDDTLSISAQVRSEVHDNSSGRQISSTSMSQFSRAIPFDTPVNAAGMKTEKSDSTVVIRIPKLS